jgi:hypothetical protein
MSVSLSTTQWQASRLFPNTPRLARCPPAWFRIFPDVLHLAVGLGQMDHQGHPVLPGDVGGFGQQIRCAQVGGVGLHGDGDQRVVAPGVDQPAGEVEAVFDGAVIGRGKIVEHFPHHRPHAGGLGGAGHGIFEQVHVAKAGGSGQDHFGTAEQRARMHLFWVQQGLGGKNVVVEPVHQRQVVGQAPEQGHGGVGVGVDQAGHDDAAGGVDRLFGRKRSDLGCGPTAVIVSPQTATAPFSMMRPSGSMVMTMPLVINRSAVPVTTALLGGSAPPRPRSGG